MQRVIGRLGGRLAFGGDYNPEQWPREVWAEDVELMREAGVTLVSVGIFSWARLEPRPGEYEFGWLDDVLDLLHAGGIAVDLATATASPPPWFTTAHPQARLVDERGAVRSHGARQAYCPSAPEYRDAATRLAGTLAQRYGEHPAVVLWHANNEYGCHNWHCYCDVSAAAFRRWLQARYDGLDALNDAWGTAFWSQRYGDWDEVLPPRAVAYRTFANPTQQLDWWRFGSDAVLELFVAEREAVRAHAAQPVTTNFMGFFKPMDYWRWAREQDIVSNDHYLISALPEPHKDLALVADLQRSLAGGEPWLLMEHSTSAVNWQPRNIAKQPGQLLRNSLQHVARGADGALFFQWRASRAGAEKFHSAMVPHAGRDSWVWREVVELGAALRALEPVAGSRVEPAPVALAFDWHSWWAAELDSHPTGDIAPDEQARAWYGALWDRGVQTDIAHPGADLSAYRVVIAPELYLLDDAAAANLAAYVRGGGTLVVTYFSGIVDEHDHIRLGGYPGALRELLGVRVEEFTPLREGETVGLSAFGPGHVWSERARADGADVRATYTDGPLTGLPAVTRHAVGDGVAWYVGTRLGADGLAGLLDAVLEGVAPVVAGLPAGCEAVRRTQPDGRTFLFLLNHRTDAVDVPAGGRDLITGTEHDGSVTVAPGGVVVLAGAGAGADATDGAH